MKQSDGNRDKLPPLYKGFLVLLDNYFATYKPHQYVFEGQMGGAYTTRSIQNVLVSHVVRLIFQNRQQYTHYVIVMRRIS